MQDALKHLEAHGGTYKVATKLKHLVPHVKHI